MVLVELMLVVMLICNAASDGGEDDGGAGYDDDNDHCLLYGFVHFTYICYTDFTLRADWPELWV